MKNFSILSVLTLLLLLVGCERKIETGVHNVHWDRDMCIRCKMVVSERHYAVQTTDPETGKTYYFDDIGCLALWFEEDKISWKDKAVIWVTDEKSGEWIDAREAKWSTESITPMAYGFAAHMSGTEPKDVEMIAFDEVIKRSIELERRKNRVAGK